MSEPPPPSHHPVVLIHPLAPDPPGVGNPCNGCGLCCLAQPCPLGMVVTRTTTGPCKALVWSDEARAYRCGLLTSPEHFVKWLPGPWVQRWAHRWIAAGQGCDAPLERLNVGS
jgi:hypothetical protein